MQNSDLSNNLLRSNQLYYLPKKKWIYLRAIRLHKYYCSICWKSWRLVGYTWDVYKRQQLFCIQSFVCGNTIIKHITWETAHQSGQHIRRVDMQLGMRYVFGYWDCVFPWNLHLFDPRHVYLAALFAYRSNSTALIFTLFCSREIILIPN